MDDRLDPILLNDRLGPTVPRTFVLLLLLVGFGFIVGMAVGRLM